MRLAERPEDVRELVLRLEQKFPSSPWTAARGDSRGSGARVRRIALLLRSSSRRRSAVAQSLPEPTGPGDLVLPPVVLESRGSQRGAHRGAPAPGGGTGASRPAVPAAGARSARDRRALAPVDRRPVLPAGDRAGGVPLATEATLGVGTPRGMSAGVQLTAAGTPGLDVSFTHESLDGFGGRPPRFRLRPPRGPALGGGRAGSLGRRPGHRRQLARSCAWACRASGARAVTPRPPPGRSGAACPSRARPAAWLTLGGGLEVANDELVLAGASPGDVTELGVVAVAVRHGGVRAVDLRADRPLRVPRGHADRRPVRERPPVPHRPHGGSRTRLRLAARGRGRVALDGRGRRRRYRSSSPCRARRSSS